MSRIMIGIDPHKATHTAVAIDEGEAVLGEFRVRASPGQVEQLRQWATGFDGRVWAVESAGGLGRVPDISRFGTKNHFAAYNATAPIEASSDENTRHRLNPRGNRQLNYVMHVAAVSQISRPGEGRDYEDRKRAEGKSAKEAIRCLKRRISDLQPPRRRRTPSLKPLNIVGSGRTPRNDSVSSVTGSTS